MYQGGPPQWQQQQGYPQPGYPAYGQQQPQGYPCARCGGPGADHFAAGVMVHRPCAGLGPDTLAWPWIVLAYVVTIPFGCTLIGAMLASIPYYLWKSEYPKRAKSYNRHVWIAFAISCLLWIGLTVVRR